MIKFKNTYQEGIYNADPLDLSLVLVMLDVVNCFRNVDCISLTFKSRILWLASTSTPMSGRRIIGPSRIRLGSAE